MNKLIIIHLLFTVVCSLSAQESSWTLKAGPYNELLLLEEGSLEHNLPATHQFIKDEFPFELKINKTFLQTTTEEVVKGIHNGRQRLSDHEWLWSLSFIKTNFFEILEKNFPKLSASERKILEQHFSEHGQCRISILDRNETCHLQNNYDWIYLTEIIVSDQVPSLKVINNKLHIPANYYAKILNNFSFSSYEIFVIIPKGTDDSVLMKASSYFENQNLSKENALRILKKARSQGFVNLMAFFPEDLKAVANQFDLMGRDFCHSTAFSFMDSKFYEYRHKALSSPDEIQRYNSDLVPIFETKYFDQIKNEENLKWGDLIQFSDKHSMVYLAKGYVFMKDGNRAQWMYRLAHLRDMLPGSNRKEYSFYPEVTPFGTFRRNKVPLDPIVEN